MKTQLCRDQDVFPSEDVLKSKLGGSFSVFEKFIKVIVKNKFRLVKECGHYGDGTSWLCKVCYKKKTVFWLSVLTNCFKVGFYFTKKKASGISKLNIKNSLKNGLRPNDKSGNLVPLIVTVYEKEQIDDVVKLIEFMMDG